MAGVETQDTNPYNDSFWEPVHGGPESEGRHGRHNHSRLGGRAAASQAKFASNKSPSRLVQSADQQKVIADIFAPGTAGYARYQQSLSEQQLQRELIFDELDLQQVARDSKARLVFKHAEGNSAFEDLSAEMQAMTVSPNFCTAEADDRPCIQVITTTQNRHEISCSLRIRSISCDLYYVPLSDNIVLDNTGDLPLSLEDLSGRLETHEVEPRRTVEVAPASWRLSNTTSTVDLQVRRRQFAARAEGTTGSSKRSAEKVRSPAKKVKGQTKNWPGSKPGGPDASSRGRIIRLPEEQEKGVWPGVNVKEHQSVHVVDTATGVPEYSLERIDGWARKTRLSHTFKAHLHDDNNTPQAVVVKIILSSSPTLAARNWRREFRAHRNLQHPCIAGLLGHDSRMLSLFVEFKPAMDLGSSRWCAQQGEHSPGFFRGDIVDAIRILTDISSALAYLEDQGIVHNDIKPGNILYTPTRWEASGGFSAQSGAVLIDFGLAGPLGEVSNGGTPWYVAPEYMGQQRGLPADVFALGVVMLYVMKCFVIPELFSRYHQVHDEWTISLVGSTSCDLQAMRAWLNTVDAQRESLKTSPSEEGVAQLRKLVRKMLLSPRERIGAKELARLTGEYQVNCWGMRG